MRRKARTPDTAARFTSEHLLAALHRRCALRLFPKPQSHEQDDRRFYIARFSSGLVKVGIAQSIAGRLASLPSEAARRFPDLDFSHDVIVPVAVVPDEGGRPIEVAMLRQLHCERVQGEWFRGPLSDAIVAALQAEPIAEAQAAE